MVSQKPFGVLAEYQSSADIYHAAEKVRDAGFTKWDACVPFPVHGLDKAMGLKASVLPWMVLTMGLIGGTFMICFQVWVSAVDYPLNIGGKPTWSIPAFIPPFFEFTILFSALTAAFGMFFLNKLPRWHHPLFDSARFARVTDDKFFIVIEASDPKFDLARAQDLLRTSGAVHIEIVEDAQ